MKKLHAWSIRLFFFNALTKIRRSHQIRCVNHTLISVHIIDSCVCVITDHLFLIARAD